MSWKIKILGAGSIGNHIANAARVLGWEVHICDIDPEALTRTKEMIYPSRYGQWDEEIQLFLLDEAPKGGYDLVVIGTPPDSHIRLALEAILERPRSLLIEKPLATPDLEGCNALHVEARGNALPVFVGYDHVVSNSVNRFVRQLHEQGASGLQTLDVEFREYWGGIFAAHPWLSGPRDSYLGYWLRGGGAASEHSHALNLWQHIADVAGAGRVIEVTATLDYVNDDGLYYDRLCLLNLKTEGGLVGRVVQDVLARPAYKMIKAQTIESTLNLKFGKDRDVINLTDGQFDDKLDDIIIEKTRPDDFITELRHVQNAVVNDSWQMSPIALQHGLDSMLVIAAAHKSSAEGRSVKIDYELGYSDTALT